VAPNCREESGSLAPIMPTLALWFGSALVAAAGVFYFAAGLSGQGISWAVLLCQQAPALCVNSQPLVYAAGLMLIAYLVLDRLNR
jgi:hypothetical protein